MPTPPEAITGTPTSRATARVSSRSYPSRVPSRSMLVSMNSPAPSSAARAAHATASMPVGVRPPCTYTSQRGEPPSSPLPGTRRASMATTMHCEPKRSAQRRTSSGSSTAAVFIVTLSAPAARMARTSSSLRQPAADRERDEDLLGAARREIEDDVAALVRGGDVEEDELVGALRVVPRRQLDGVAGVADGHEVDALDHPAVTDVEARDDALAVHDGRRQRAVRLTRHPSLIQLCRSIGEDRLRGGERE